MTKKFAFIVYTNPVPGRETEYNDWYDKQHLADLLNIPGIVSAHRYKHAPVEDSAIPTQPYLAIYMIEATDAADVWARIRAAANTPAMMLSDALDGSRTQASFFELISGS